MHAFKNSTGEIFLDFFFNVTRDSLIFSELCVKDSKAQREEVHLWDQGGEDG